MKIITLLAVMVLAINRAAAAAPSPVITPLPPGAVTIDSCKWKATPGAFDADIRLKDHTNLKIAKARFLITFINVYGEAVQGYADMTGSTVALAPGMPLLGKWNHGTFPMSMKNIQCALVGVKFRGYPDVIFSTVK